MSGDAPPTAEQLAADLAALRSAIALVTKPALLSQLGHLARRALSIDEVLIDLDAEVNRARAASDGFAERGRYDLAAGERDRVRELSALATALRACGAPQVDTAILALRHKLADALAAPAR